jgi:asparagine synthase (glutamine-hydrolysing)
MLNLVHFHEISILDEIKKYYDIVLNGWGCENTIKGQFLNKKILLSKNDNELSVILFKKLMTISEEERNLLFSQNYYSKIKDLAFKALQKELNKSKNRLSANRSDYFVFQNRERRSIHIANTVYQRNKFESEEPFIDNDFVDFSLKIPPELRFDHHIYFKFLKELSPELSKIPVSPAGIQINVPHTLYNLFSLKKAVMRKIKNVLRIKTRGLVKIPFKDDYPDYGEWIRTNEKLRKWVEGILLDERTLNKKYFNRDFIVKMVNNHMSYKQDHTQLLFTLLTFELWYRASMEGGTL